MIRGYLDTCISLPWNKYSKDQTNIKKAQQILDKDHYGMKRVKERILENLAVKISYTRYKGSDNLSCRPSGSRKDLYRKIYSKSFEP